MNAVVRGDLSSYYEANMRFSDGENVIGSGCKISPLASLDSSVLMDNVEIEDGCSVCRSVICEGCVIGEGSSVGNGCVIGSDCVIGSGAVLEDGVIIKSGSRIPDGLIMRRSSAIGSVRQASELLFDYGIRFEMPKMGEQFLFRLGMAIAETMKAFNLSSAAMMNSEETVCHRLIRGLRSGGVECSFLGVGFEAAAASAPRLLGVDISVFACQKDEIFSVYLFDRNGLYPSRDFERKLILFLTEADKNESSRADAAGYPSNIGEVKRLDFLDEIYLPELISVIKKQELQQNTPIVTVNRDNLPSLYLTRALIEAGIPIGTEEDGSKRVKMTFSLSPDGKDVFVCVNDGSSEPPEDYICIDFYHVIALLCRDLCNEGKKFSLPVTIPQVLKSRLSMLNGQEIPTYSSCPCDKTEAEARGLAATHPELTDGLFASAFLISLIVKKSAEGISVSRLLFDLPSFFVSRDELEADTISSISAISKVGTPSKEGVAIRYSGGFVRAVPSGKGIRLTAEAASGEYASEILDISKKKLSEFLKNPPRA